MFKKMSLILAMVLVAITVPSPVAYADAGSGGGDYVPLPSTPVVLDTRSGIGGVTGQRGAASTTTFPVLGVGGIPTSGVGSVVLRLALVDPTASTWATAYPDGTSRPTLTTVATVATEDISNIAVVKVGTSGKVSVYNDAGKTHLVAEVQGYFKNSQGTTGGGFVPVPYTKLVDTRTGLGTATGTIPAGGTRTVTITGGLIPAGAAAAWVELLVPSASVSSWLAVAPGTGTARPVLNYQAGTTQTSAVLALPADGRVTFTNKSTAAINLGVSAQGYFTASPTQGAGLRQVASRLYNTRTVGAGLPLAANATLDIQVGGTNGLPTRGVAGAALVILATPTEAGWLKTWPVGQSEPATTMMDFKADVWRGNTIVVKPGTDGKVRIRNGSDGTVHLAVDLLGWFADPLPTVPIARDTRMTALQAAPVAGATIGTLEYAYVDNGGRVVWGHQSNVDSFGTVQWTVLPGNEAFTGTPTLLQLNDGRLQISAQHIDGDIWAITQTAAGAATWNAWADLGGSMATPPDAAKLGDGTPVQFSVDADGKLWAFAQNGAVPFWRDLGDQDLTGTVRVTQVRDGLQVFALTTGGAVRTIRYFNDGAVSAWTNLGGLGLNSTPAVVVRPGFFPQVFVRGADGVVMTKLQDIDGTWPATWQPVSTLTAAGSPAAIMDPALGRIAVVVRGTDNELYHAWETANASNTWGNPQHTAGDPPVADPAATDPAVAPFTNSNGPTFLIGFLNPNGATRFYDRRSPTS